jgi:hypothetical protein
MLFPNFAQKKVDTKRIAPAGSKVLYRPLEELIRAVKYFTARWSLEQVVKCFFTARQSRENRHAKKKRGRQYDDSTTFRAAGIV